MALTDTDAATMGRLDELYRRMTPAEKLRRVRELTLMADSLALAGLRARHGDDSEGKLMMRLARIRLGSDLFDRAFPGVLGSDDA